MNTPPSDDASAPGAEGDPRIEAMLRARYDAQDDGEEHADLELLARHLEGRTTAAEVARVAALMSQAGELSEAVAHIRDEEGDAAVISLAEARERKRRTGPIATMVRMASLAQPARRSSQRAWVGALAAAALALVGVTLYLTGPRGGDGGHHVGAGFGGGQDRIAITQTPGDAERFTVTIASQSAGHLTVVEVGADGSAAPVQGATEASATADGVVAFEHRVSAAGPGCRWLVAIVADAPVDAQSVAAAVAKAPREDGTCELRGLSRGQLPAGTRTVRTAVVAR